MVSILGFREQQQVQQKMSTCNLCTGQCLLWWSHCTGPGMIYTFQYHMTCMVCNLWCPCSCCPGMSPACRSQHCRKSCTLGIVLESNLWGLLLCTLQPCRHHLRGSMPVFFLCFGLVFGLMLKIPTKLRHPI